MRVGITGSWKQKNQSLWALRSDFASFTVACRELGYELVASGAKIVVGSERVSTADKHIVEAYPVPAAKRGLVALHPAAVHFRS